MIKIILTGIVGFLFLSVFSFLIVWLDDRSKKEAKQKLTKKFQDFDKYYNQLKNESEQVASVDVSVK